MNSKTPLKIDINTSNKKIYFGEKGDKVIVKEKQVKTQPENVPKQQEDGFIKKKHKQRPQKQNGEDLGIKWYQVYEEYNTSEFKDIKDSELKILTDLCRSSFNEEIQKLAKNNPSDAKWLHTALHKGTSKDRANAGALLVQSNPLPNISALESLISLTKLSNKTNIDVFETLTDLFINSLLPSHRKLIPIQNRGNDWKALKSKTLDKAIKDQIYAHWHYENQLRDQYHEFLLNIQSSLQNGKEAAKIKAIISASKLLKSCPEREAFLLAVLVNKFGDPDKKIASKATYNLRQILLTHPNMAHVMVLDTEKLIFRNNITELAQHYGIGFLSLIAPISNVETSLKLINICFCFFKIKIEKGDINSKTMQSILHCLRMAIQNINDFNEEKKSIEITTPDVVNTIYRLIYLSNVSISFQALSLLLELVLVQDEKHDRYYNALYRKMLDPGVISASNKITSLYFHIIHRSIHKDPNVARAKAFIKRLLQMTLSFSPAKVCGALIVINKLLKSRPELVSFSLKTVVKEEKKETAAERKLSKFDDDSDEEVYQDVVLDDSGKEVRVERKQPQGEGASSWVHSGFAELQKTPAESQKLQTQYDPYKRSAAYCGSEFTTYYELTLLARNFHPTVQVFVENILKHQKVRYYGDPLKDFSLSHFLDRFSFKNPKKIQDTNQKSPFNHNYQAKGSRGQSVYLLTSQSCTEDEKFIFDFIQRKREIREKNEKFKDEKDDDLESVDDDEFDAYLHSLGAANDMEGNDEDFDYMSEMQKDGKNNVDKTKKKGKARSVDEEPSDDDWGSAEGESDDDAGDESGTDQSIEENEMSDASEMDSDDNEAGNVGKKPKKSKDKNENLFVAVDDFSELIEQNSSNSHGTLGEIFNKDKSSQQQLDWEQKRHGGMKFKRKNSISKKNFGHKAKKFKK